MKTHFHCYSGVMIGVLLCGGARARSQGNTVAFLQNDFGIVLSSVSPKQSVLKLAPFKDSAARFTAGSVPAPNDTPTDKSFISVIESQDFVLLADLDDNDDSSDEDALVPHNWQLAASSGTSSVRLNVFFPNSPPLLPTRPPP